MFTSKKLQQYTNSNTKTVLSDKIDFLGLIAIKQNKTKQNKTKQNKINIILGFTTGSQASKPVNLQAVYSLVLHKLKLKSVCLHGIYC